jgi:hypothetical protein
MTPDGRTDGQRHNIIRPVLRRAYKNQWIRTKLKLDLYLGMAKQCTKYQMNMRKKVCKTDSL